MVKYNIFNTEGRMTLSTFLEKTKNGYYFDPKEHKIYKIVNIKGEIKRTKYHCVIKTEEKDFNISIDVISFNKNIYVFAPRKMIYIFRNIENISNFLKDKYQKDVMLLNKYKKQYESKMKKLESFTKFQKKYPEFFI